jgi:16S rRNA (guanine966-N2)-methyltransferase
LFNWLQPVIDGASCLDLFAGTGALGLEALSRGAEHVVMVENDPVLIKQLSENIKTLEAAAARLETGDALNWLKANSGKFDLVFLDPPFGHGLIQKSCDLLRETDCLKPQASIYIECEPELELPGYLAVKKQGKAGQVKYLLASLN